MIKGIFNVWEANRFDPSINDNKNELNLLRHFCEGIFLILSK